MCADDFLILVDDYIGTGNTLAKTLEQISKNPSIATKFAILSISMQKQAAALLNDKGITYYTAYIENRGISDNFAEEKLVEKLGVMTKIENRIPNIKDYRFGYEKSEALITLIKTPNNTFPVFWKGILHKGVEFQAPFQRH